MANPVPNKNMSREEYLYHEYSQRANDFLKIEMYRPALKWLNKARSFEINTADVDQKIKDCKEKIRKETRIIGMVAIVAFVVVIILLITY